MALGKLGGVDLDHGMHTLTNRLDFMEGSAMTHCPFDGIAMDDQDGIAGDISKLTVPGELGVRPLINLAHASRAADIAVQIQLDRTLLQGFEVEPGQAESLGGRQLLEVLEHLIVLWRYVGSSQLRDGHKQWCGLCGNRYTKGKDDGYEPEDADT